MATLSEIDMRLKVRDTIECHEVYTRALRHRHTGALPGPTGERLGPPALQNVVGIIRDAMTTELVFNECKLEGLAVTVLSLALPARQRASSRLADSP